MARIAWWIPVLIVVLCGCTGSAPKEPVNLGHLLPLSGPDRAFGRQAQRGVLLAVEEINQDDKGVLGHSLIVQNLDTRGEADTAQGEAVRLLSLSHVTAIIAGPDATIAERVVRTTQSYQVPVIVPGEMPESFAEEGAIYLGVNPRNRGQLLAEYAAKELKAKHAVVLLDKRNADGKSVADSFQEEWSRGMRTTPDQWSFADLSAVDDLTKRLTAAAPDVVLVCGSVVDFLKVRSQCENAKIAIPLLYGGEDAGPASFQGNPDGPDVYLATIDAAEALTLKGKEFAKKYEERFHEPPDLAAIHAYDSVRLATETMQRLNSVAAADLRTELGKVDKFESLLGTVTWKDHKAQRSLFVVRLHNNEPTVVKKPE